MLTQHVETDVSRYTPNTKASWLAYSESSHLGKRNGVEAFLLMAHGCLATLFDALQEIVDGSHIQ